MTIRSATWHRAGTSHRPGFLVAPHKRGCNAYILLSGGQIRRCGKKLVPGGTACPDHTPKVKP